MSFLISALAIVLVFGIVIFVHEFGHFIVAKKTGVKVERFSFGLGPEMVGFQWGETRYCLAWIPLGGEVRMAGEMDFEEGDPTAPPPVKNPRDFYAQPWYRRIPIVLAGPAMNYVLAFFCFALLAAVWGDPRLSSEPVVGGLMDRYPAQEAGLQMGDRVVSLNGAPVSTWQDLAQKIQAAPDQALLVEYERGGAKNSVSLVPRRDPKSGTGLVGITPATEYVRVGFLQSLSRGVQQCVGLSYYTLHYLGDKIMSRQKPDLAGPLGIAQVVSKATKQGIQDLIYLVALISVGIGLFNLFPIPLLDGGHAAFFIWEGLTKKPVTRRAMSVANTVGLSLLLGIFLFATYSDIQRLRPARQSTDAPSIQP